MSYMTFISSLVERSRAVKILDVGCGDGRMLDFIRQRSMADYSYTGIDLCEEAIALARVLNGGGKFLSKDIKEIDETFDIVLLIEVLEHIPDSDVSSFLRGVKNTLNEKGSLILSVPTSNVPVHPKHYRHYGEKELVEVLEKEGFVVDRLHYVSPRSKWLSAIRVVMANDLYVLSPSRLTKVLWALYGKLVKPNVNNCLHFVVEARLA